MVTKDTSLNTQTKEEEKDVDSVSLEEFSKLREGEQAKLVEYNQSLVDYEKAKGRRILFDRAPEETLPFIAYCVYVSAQAIIATIVLVSQSGGNLPYYLIIAGAMILPLVALPSGSFYDTFQWIKSYLDNFC